MSKGAKAFKIIISSLLSLCILSIAILFICIYYFDQVVINQEDYGIFVAGVSVTRENEDDILGDGSVYFDLDRNTLFFDNAQITTDESMIVSFIDIGIYLIGENKFISSSDTHPVFISAVDYYNAKDIYIYGDGSLTIEFLTPRTDSAVLQCSDLSVMSDITITTPECSNLSNGIVCDSSFKLMDGATLTVNGNSAKSLVAFRVRGNMILESGTAVNVNVANGSADGSRGITVAGDLIIGDGASVNVAMADDSAKLVECVRVNGLLDVGLGATLTASTAKSYAVECYGSIKLCDDAVFSATSTSADVDAICYGAVTNYGATVTGDIEALGQIHDKSAQ